MKINKVLIANRGEIAVRIIRAAKDVGLQTVAVYADQDAEAMHVRMADEAISLTGESLADTYLNIDKVLSAAENSGADTIHPGYGFLAESAEFARAVIDRGYFWVGPSPEVIETLGNKAKARELAAQVGAPLIPGTNTPVAGVEEVEALALSIGLPIVIKAVYGGGGRGMRVVHSLDDVAAAYQSAVNEAQMSFGRSECVVEKYLEKPRHIEVQVLGDIFGTVAVVGTRDCSLQRRSQKLVEEAPAPFLSEQENRQIRESARELFSAVGYVGVGTVEFLLGRDGSLTFLEVNTRIQVEHPVTELTSGIDLVIEQLRIAAGLPTAFDEDVEPQGHAFEFRINAEDPGLGFLPTPGKLALFRTPDGPGVRVDAGYDEGDTIHGSYDSLIAKLVVWGRTRDEALARSRRALAEFTVEGPATVLPFHRHVVSDPVLQSETFAAHTRWIEEECDAVFEPVSTVEYPDGASVLRFSIELDGRISQIGIPSAVLQSLGGITLGEANFTETSVNGDAAGSRATGAVRAPFAGTLTSWSKNEGQRVDEDEVIAVLEAMKMEVQVRAPHAGLLTQCVPAGSQVNTGQTLATLEH